jgi:hypothetical protein
MASRSALGATPRSSGVVEEAVTVLRMLVARRARQIEKFDGAIGFLY